MKKIVMFATLASTLLASCSSEEIVSTKEIPAPLKELSFTVGVVNPTKAGLINGVTFTDVANQIGMFVINSDGAQHDYDVTTENFKVAQFEPGRKTDTPTEVDNTKQWTCLANKIYLSNQVANVYAFYPYAPATDVSRENKDIKISVSSTQDFSASAQNDYMYATKSATVSDGLVTASNATDANTAKLFFHHALAKLTFKIKKSTTYGTTPSAITSIVLSNMVAGSQFSKTGETSRMSLVDGTLKVTTADEATLTFAEADVTFNANATTNAAGQVTKAGKNFLIEGLVVPTGLLPTATTGLTAANAIKITLTVDGNPIVGYIPCADNAKQWKAGENYVYTITVNGTELIVDKTVTVVNWTPQIVDGDINVAG